MSSRTVLEVQDLKAYFYTRWGVVKAVDGVSFDLGAGETIGLVGESGCGKSTLARLILGLLPADSGEIAIEGQRLADMDRKARARLIQPVFQDPFASRNPLARVRDIIAMPLRAQGRFGKAEIIKTVEEMLARVGLSREMGGRLPAELSGGQQQQLGRAYVACAERVRLGDMQTAAQSPRFGGALRSIAGGQHLDHARAAAGEEHRPLAAPDEVGRERSPDLDLVADLEHVEGGVALVFEGKSIRFPGHAAAEVEACFEHEEPTRVSDLPGDLDLEGRLVLVRRLVRERSRLGGVRCRQTSNAYRVGFPTSIGQLAQSVFKRIAYATGGSRASTTRNTCHPSGSTPVPNLSDPLSEGFSKRGFQWEGALL